MRGTQGSKTLRWLLSSPPIEWASTKLQELLINSLKQGPIPQHVAFIMDGNRRFARQSKLETVEGHNLGFEALARILEICFKSGVKVVTIYAFSIENFKRSKFEVDALMDMAKIKLLQLSQHGDLMDRFGACMRVLGQTSLCTPEVREAIHKAMELTKHNNRAILNVCFPYTSLDELTTSIRSIVTKSTIPQSSPPSPSLSEASNSDCSTATSTTVSPLELMDIESITEQTIETHLFTAGCPPLDLLIRTSGVERLSDFLLWQCHKDTHVEFVDVLWPQFDVWTFLPILISWGIRRKKEIERDMREESESRSKDAVEVRVRSDPVRVSAKKTI